MTTRSKRVKLAFLTAAAAVALLAGTREAAAQQKCMNDIDCPEPACGGQVCNWNIGMVCNAAGTDAVGQDGWCMMDTDCKCKGMGATCKNFYCTFTKPPGGTGGASGGGTGGASGGGTGGSSGTGSGGSTGGGTDAGTTPPKDSGGCSVAGNTDVGAFGALAGIGLLGLVLASRRRKA